MKQEVKDTVRDYRDVLKEIVVEAGNRPVTTALKAYAVGVAAWATKHAPDMLEYQYQLVEASTDLGEVPDPIRRQSSQDHVSNTFQTRFKHASNTFQTRYRRGASSCSCQHMPAAANTC